MLLDPSRRNYFLSPICSNKSS